MSLLGKVNIRDTVRFTENDAIPIYRQIAESLRQSILSGEFKEGCKLPSEIGICKRTGHQPSDFAEKPARSSPNRN